MRKAVVILTVILVSGCARMVANLANATGVGPRNTPDHLMRQFRCNYDSLDAQYTHHSNEPVPVGADPCIAIGRFGAPQRWTVTSFQGSMSYFLSFNRASVTVSKYYDNETARIAGRPANQWVVEMVSMYDAY